MISKQRDMTRAEYDREYRQARRETARLVIAGKRKIRQEYIKVFSRIARVIRENKHKPFLEEQIRSAFPKQELYEYLKQFIMEGRGKAVTLMAGIDKRYVVEALGKVPGHGLSVEKIGRLFDQIAEKHKQGNEPAIKPATALPAVPLLSANSRKQSHSRKCRHTHSVVSNVKERKYTGTGSGEPFVYTFRQSYSLSKSLWAAVEDTEDKIMDVVWGGISQGRDVRTVAADLMAYLKGGPDIIKGRWGKLKPGEKILKGGHWQYATDEARQYAKRLGSKGVDYRAMRLYRSEIHRHQQEAAVEDGEDNPACTGEYDWILMPGREVWLCGCEELATGGPYTKDTIPPYPHPNYDCMVRPRLKDHKEFMRDLKDYVKGVPSEGANEISLWAQEHGLGEDGLAIIPPKGVQPPGLETDIQNELRDLLNYGVVTGRERVSFMKDDGMKITTRDGKKTGYAMPERLRKMIEEESENSIIVLHNHPSGGSFSGDDLFDLLRMKSVKEIRVIGHNRRTYRMAVGNGVRSSGESKEKVIFLKIFEDYLANNLLKYFGSSIDYDALQHYITNDTNMDMKNKFGWYYEDGKLNDR
jgi:hypothetical protein